MPLIAPMNGDNERTTDCEKCGTFWMNVIQQWAMSKQAWVILFGCLKYLLYVCKYIYMACNIIGDNSVGDVNIHVDNATFLAENLMIYNKC